jgi:phosphoglycolate phosphatase-like HAD superfamily hydrolase
MSYTDYIWDLGGTLLDNYQTSATAFHDVLLESFGVNVGYHAVYDALRVSTDFAVSQFAAGLPDFVAMYKKEGPNPDDTCFISRRYPCTCNHCRKWSSKFYDFAS